MTQTHRDKQNRLAQRLAEGVHDLMAECAQYWLTVDGRSALVQVVIVPDGQNATEATSRALIRMAKIEPPKVTP